MRNSGLFPYFSSRERIQVPVLKLSSLYLCLFMVRRGPAKTPITEKKTEMMRYYFLVKLLHKVSNIFKLNYFLQVKIAQDIFHDPIVLNIYFQIFLVGGEVHCF